MSDTTKQPPEPDRIPGQPDVNAGALRPSTKPDESDPRPDIDHPPKADTRDKAGFDQAEIVEERERRTGTLPGYDQDKGTPLDERDLDRARRNDED
ncbi:hypothetical protein [Bordetella genomosp. 13]|uniref:hypothetical protein n=1 Tax=Bordetella genomosp. 13 TaxID=463040 RepID=UPI0011A14AB9|nr:hypothetical protein [Bordetella genomosp. 13]